MAANISLSKAQQLLLAIFGKPVSGFIEVGYPTELDVVSYHLWLMELTGGDKRGSNRKEGFGDAVTTIANSLMVHWRITSPDVALVNEDCVKAKVRKIIARVEPLRKFTRELGNEDWIATQRKSFLAIIDIAAKDEESGSDGVS